ncbi:ABC transporter permease [Pelistega indica]|uniref:ABC transporter permease n=1 Tax=Pelistega indica TaxID=1414851 RepID=V8GAA0_9BURK|nr:MULTISPECIES: ABC transporter permease subunit [Pelistega]ETD73026.1 ABC transporter permease [Pelistega indica]
MNNKKIALLALIPFAVFFLLFEFAPLLWVAVNSFYVEDIGWGIQNYVDIISSKFYVQSMIYSIKITWWSSLFGLVIAIIGTYSLTTLKFSKLHHFLISFNTVASNFAGIPLSFAFIILIGANGAFNLILKHFGVDIINLYSQTGIIIIYTYFQIPLAVLLLYPAFDAIKKEWQEAAMLMGASHLAYWRYIVIPMLSPALLGTLVILFANALGAYATIYALTSGNFNVMPIRIGALVSGDVSLNPYMASALSVYLIAMMMLIVIAQRYIAKRYHYVNKA